MILVELTDIARLNSREGCASGDEAIRAAARCFQRIAVRVGGTPCRYSGHRLGLVVPAAGHSRAFLLAAEISQNTADDPPLRAGTSAWRPGDDGDSVAIRAKADLERSA